MGLFGKKKKEEVPDFRQNIPYLPTSPSDVPPVPSLKKPSLKEQLGVGGELPPLPPMPQKEKALPPLPPMRKPALPPKLPRLAKVEEMPSAPTASKPSHVFVRLDKYKSIIKAINNMENKLNELRSTITKINSIKEKENEIIEGWAALLHDAKARVEDVSNKLPDVERA